MGLFRIKSDAGGILVARLFWCKMDNHIGDLVHIGTSDLDFFFKNSKIMFLSIKNN
jgi:hypothetical protein